VKKILQVCITLSFKEIVTDKIRGEIQGDK